MKNAGIDNGEYVVDEKQTTVSEGEIVAALVDNESTLKRFYHDKENNQVILRPENEKYSDILVHHLVRFKVLQSTLLKHLLNVDRRSTN